MFVFCLLHEDELSFSSGSSLITDYSSVSIESTSVPPTTTPKPSCMCNLFDCVCNTVIYNVCFFVQTAPLVSVSPAVVVGVVSIGFIIVTVVVITVLILGKKYKCKKNSPGEDEITLLLLLVFVYCCCFPQLPLTIFTGHILPKRTGLFCHMHMQNCRLTTCSFNFAA